MRCIYLYLAVTFAFLGLSATVLAQDVKPRPTGKHVTLCIGPGFSLTSAQAIAGYVQDEGCPATLHNDGLFNNSIDVEVGDDWVTFEKAGSAGSERLFARREQRRRPRS